MASQPFGAIERLIRRPEQFERLCADRAGSLANFQRRDADTDRHLLALGRRVLQSECIDRLSAAIGEAGGDGRAGVGNDKRRLFVAIAGDGGNALTAAVQFTGNSAQAFVAGGIPDEMMDQPGPGDRPDFA